MSALRLCSLALVGAHVASCQTAAPQPTPTPTSAPAAAEVAPGGRLPADVRPTDYRLHLQVVPAHERFAGDIEIDIVLERPRQQLWLHSRGLDISRATVHFDGRELVATAHATDPSGTTALDLPAAVGPGRATIAITYGAPFGLPSDGLFKVHSGNADYAFTQFEPIAARRAFPCFDEPGFKTPFDLELTVGANDVAVANTPVSAEDKLADGRRKVRFARTRPLPSYLVAFAVGPFEVVTAPAVPANKVRTAALALRGLTTQGQSGKLGYALTHTGELLALLEDFIGSPYPFEKLDLLAIPGFGGAMENPGLVTFDDALLLVDEKRDPVAALRSHADTVVHELSHMWFGDQVTMRWWDDLWLNEAFATWITPKIVHRFRPDYGMALQFMEAKRWAMSEDSLLSARRIRQPIASADDILTAFDSITYTKGAAVIGMFEQWIGADAFLKGVREYLARHAWGNATVDDLLGALDRAAGKDVATPFRTFLDQPGVPLVQVDPACRNGLVELRLQQSRYLPVGSSDASTKLWQIPLCIRFGTDGAPTSACTLVTQREQTIPLAAAKCDRPIHPNAEGTGYYRWMLSSEALRTLTAARQQLTPAERLSLADAMRAGFRAGRIDTRDVLQALLPLVGDDEPSVASAPSSTLMFVRDELVDAAQRPLVLKQIKEAYRPVLERVGFKSKRDENWRAAERRELALTMLAFWAEDANQRAELAKLARAYLGVGDDGKLHPEAIAPNLIGIALMAAVRDDPAFFELLIEKMATEQDGTQRYRYLAAISAAVEPAQAKRALELTLDPRLRPGELWSPLATQLNDARTRAAAWGFFKQNFDALRGRLPEDYAAYMPSVARGMCSEVDASTVEQFFSANKDKLRGGERTLAQTLESIRLCAALAAAQRAGARDYFANPFRKK